MGVASEISKLSLTLPNAIWVTALSKYDRTYWIYSKKATFHRITIIK